MKMTRNQLINHYEKTQAKNGFTPGNTQDLIGSFKTKQGLKLVLMVDVLDRTEFKKACILKNSMNAKSMIVYCDTATYSPCNSDVSIHLNRNQTEMY